MITFSSFAPPRREKYTPHWDNNPRGWKRLSPERASRRTRRAALGREPYPMQWRQVDGSVTRSATRSDRTSGVEHRYGDEPARRSAEHQPKGCIEAFDGKISGAEADEILDAGDALLRVQVARETGRAVFVPSPQAQCVSWKGRTPPRKATSRPLRIVRLSALHEPGRYRIHAVLAHEPKPRAAMTAGAPIPGARATARVEMVVVE
jgi:hypothetical protein